MKAGPKTGFLPGRVSQPHGSKGTSLRVSVYTLESAWAVVSWYRSLLGIQTDPRSVAQLGRTHAYLFLASSC